MSILKQQAGIEVAVERPVKTSAVAHRPRYYLMGQPHPRYPNHTEKVNVVGAKCATDDDAASGPAKPCAQFSAGWAHHIGAVPCTAPECFGGQA